MRGRGARSESVAMRGQANCRGTRVGEPPRHALWRFAAKPSAARVADRNAVARRVRQQPRPRFGFSTLTVQRSTEPPLRGKAPASPLTAAPAEMRQEVRPCVSFLAMSLVGRNRRVSTMGVYQPRQRLAAPQPPRPTVPDAPSRRGVARSAAPCYPRVLRLSPAVLNPRCHATPSPPQPPKNCRGAWVCRSRHFAKCLETAALGFESAAESGRTAALV